MLKAGNFSFKFGSCEIKLKHIESGNHILEICAAATVFLAFLKVYSKVFISFFIATQRV